MFPKYTIHAITNGVHAATWSAPSLAASSTGGCRSGGAITCTCGTRSTSRSMRSRRRTCSPNARSSLASARLESRVRREVPDDRLRAPCGALQARGVAVYGRRTAAPHRANGPADTDRLRRKAHPRDRGRRRDRRVIPQPKRGNDIKFVYVEYDLAWAICSRAASTLAEHAALSRRSSGTSGMKAALNGVPSFSVATAGGSKATSRAHRLVDRGEVPTGVNADEAATSSQARKLDRTAVHGRPQDYTRVRPRQSR